jgi:hypothetical protein
MHRDPNRGGLDTYYYDVRYFRNNPIKIFEPKREEVTGV